MMSVTITLPEALEEALQRQAVEQQRSIQEHAIVLLQHALDEAEPFPTLEDVVAQIKAADPHPHSMRPAQSSLANYLCHAPDDPQFDLVRWNQE